MNRLIKNSLFHIKSDIRIRTYSLSQIMKSSEDKINNLNSNIDYVNLAVNKLTDKVGNLGNKINHLDHNNDYLNSGIDNLNKRVNHLADKIEVLTERVNLLEMK